jgi:pteridine reductase
MELAGRLALITGSGVRLGRALAKGLDTEGVRLALHYHKHREEAEELARQVRFRRPSEGAASAGCFEADLAEPESMARLSHEVEATMGPVDILLLSAAIYPREPLEEITAPSLERAIRINLSSPILLARDIGLRMKLRGAGDIVALLDWSLDRPYPDRLPYTVAKAGLRAGILGLARILAPEVRVNAIAPGAVLLPEGSDAALEEGIRQATPLGRIGRPQDVVEAAIYLLKAGFVTGTILTVDGGRSIA